MGILAWVVLGAIAGWLATLFIGTNKTKHGYIFNIVVGIIGAFVGGFVFKLLGGTGITGFNIYSIIVATIGAIILIWVINKIR